MLERLSKCFAVLPAESSTSSNGLQRQATLLCHDKGAFQDALRTHFPVFMHVLILCAFSYLCHKRINHTTVTQCLRERIPL